MEQLSYDDFLIAIINITKRIKKEYKNSFDNIYGIPRGGLIPTVYLSHLLKLPIVMKPAGKETIIVDDICDFGKTLLPYKDAGYTTVTLYYHKHSCVEPDIWIYEKTDKWIKFFWEIE